MLKVVIPKTDLFDERTETFMTIGPYTIALEHSLVSISKWESTWEKPFLSDNNKSNEEIIDYIKCMTITQNVDRRAYEILSRENIDAIISYINKPSTATWFSNKNGAPSRRITTSELIYYWMTALQIPFECQKWHLNRLLTLIRICNEENNQSKKKMSKSEIAQRNRALNEQRKRQYSTTG